MEPEMIEIPPPVPRTLRRPKKKEVIFHQVIDVDKDEDVDIISIEDNVGRKNKGKVIKNGTEASSNDQIKKNANFFPCPDVEALELVNGVNKSSIQGLDKAINLDGLSTNLSVDKFSDDDCTDLSLDNFMDIDKYESLQAHFDRMDVPPGVEASVPWFSAYVENKKTASGTNLYNSFKGIEPSLSSSLLKPPQLNMETPVNKSLPTPMDSVGHPSGVDFFSPMLQSQINQRKEKLRDSRSSGSALNIPLDIDSESSLSLAWSCGKKSGSSSNSTISSSSNTLNAVMHPAGVEPCLGTHAFSSSKHHGVPSSLYYPYFDAHPPQPYASIHPPILEPSMTSWPVGFNPHMNSFSNYTTIPRLKDPFNTANIFLLEEGANINHGVSDGNDILGKFEHFKQFDSVEDYSDHHYNAGGSSMKQLSTFHLPPKNWAKRIQEEWRILENDLPDMIFVRVYEKRMDLLRAVIMGAQCTPYHDGLFFFDVFFPSGYPGVPPHVYYRSGGLRLNPNLYNCGKVCISLLNTWGGGKNEKWIPNVSTILQVLVSIQALILNQKPFFNEPGWAPLRGSENGESRSQQYNEDTFILSLWTMIYTMRMPPKHFEDFVRGHFYNRAHDILIACKAYMDGAQVGCLIKDGVQDVDQGDKRCSEKFKGSLPGVIEVLLGEFKRIGAMNLEKFQKPAEKESGKS
ncbi:Ubiquitin-conjugating enzyme 25 putative isoform 1 [Tripterygium wilfordii]|uniref:E2 ubiquitin-conjugating enzyme n=1 Tax=Tripterygium wilfordii TaxID=458696 RepID=A0A7J7C961_TRIWF|nr:probable ubiquitin-conjugating enzyme E2 26 [Tripterygium wilfordii]KAF5730673.1 Ubiquitin-conjugating enzyme 25 putative isoform 1 [Tripterygium wilfordii]